MSLQVPATRQDPVRVVFCIQKPCFDSTTERVGIVASPDLDKELDLNSVREASFTGINGWMLETCFPPNTVVDFRLLVIRYPNTDFLFEGFDEDGSSRLNVLHVEDKWLRRLILTDLPLRVQMTYNQSEVKVVVSRSTLTKAGLPVKLKGATPKKTAVFLPKQLGWNFIEEDSLTRSEQFNRVDTAIYGGTMFTTIRASLAEQRRQENIRTLQSGVSECLCAKEPIPKDDDNDTEMTRKVDQICPKQTFRPEAVERQNNVNAMGDFKRVFFPNPEVVNTNNTDVLNSGAASRWSFGSANAKEKGSNSTVASRTIRKAESFLKRTQSYALPLGLGLGFVVVVACAWKAMR